MATSPGWATLGSTIAGGNKLPEALAYDQGEALGARTQDALAQARARVQENNARENIGQNLDALPENMRGTLAALIQAHVDPAQVFNSAKTNQEIGYRGDIVNPNTSDPEVARRLLALGQPADIIKSEGEGQVTNRLHPDQGVQLTDIGTSIAGKNRAATQLDQDKVQHPEKYRLLPPPTSAAGGAPDGSTPLNDNETAAQLIAAGQMQAPTPGTRAYLMLGGDTFMRRVNYLAGPKGAAPPAAAPTGAPPVAPGAVAPPTVPGAAPTAPTAPAATTPGVVPPGTKQDSSGVVLPSDTTSKQPGFQANFDANAYGMRRTALNDLSRKNGTGGNDDALNRTAGHLDVYEQLMRNSGNTNFTAGNALKNWFQAQTGQPWPGQADLAAHVLGTEIVKSMTQVGAGSTEERTGLAKQFSNAKSLADAAGAIQTAQDLLRAQATATNQRVSAAGVKDYYSKYLEPTTRRRLKLGEFDTAAPGAAGAAPPAAAGGADNDPLGIRGLIGGK